MTNQNITSRNKKKEIDSKKNYRNNNYSKHNSNKE